MHPKILRAQEIFISWDLLETDLKKLDDLLKSNEQQKIVNLLEKLVNGYKPSKKIVDWIFNERLRKKKN